VSSTLTTTAGDRGTRLDVFLARALPELSRSRIQQLIRAGHVTVAGRAAKVSTALEPDLTIEITIPAAAAAEPLPESLPLEILHDDEDIVVINKPWGMVVHPAAGHASGTLVNALLHHVRGLSGIGGAERPGIVHRLDRGTSGVMVVAKNDRAHRSLTSQFHDRAVTKEYIALVWGRPAPGLMIDRPIGRDPRHRQRMSSRARRGRPAVTTVTHVEPLGGVSLVRVAIGTGRTHQIRVHLSEAGYPIVGDALYGGGRKRLSPEVASVGRLERPFLHAARLGFAHPADERSVTFEAPLAPDLAAVLDTLRRVWKEPT
jgi:23S rRNA pseudouridine1911/1915/1917 synthase